MASQETNTMKRFDRDASAWMIALALTSGTAGCSKKEPEQTAPSVASRPAPVVVPATTPADPAADARALFKLKCVVCHGDHGAGDGPGAAAIVPKPRAFADPEWQASVTDEHIKKIIVEGGAAVGKSPAMPPNPDLKSKDDVVAALVKVVRDFKK
jgi:mono/diheme cytochrome c family protein